MKILYVTTIGITMCFFPEHIKMLLAEGHTVELACNDAESKVPEIYHELGLKIHTIPFSRSPLSKSNITAYKQLKKLVQEGNYDIVHTHTPNASAIVRLACSKLRKQGLKVFYTAHGFHFYKGAPLLNWLIYYPIEKFCSRFTDTLITINKEDYERASSKMHAKRTEIIPGVGVDLGRFQNAEVDRMAVRAEFGISADAKVLIYIAELNKNKNQTSLLDMMAELNKVRQDVVLLLVGPGDMRSELEEKAKKLGIADKVVFTGFRKDVPQLLRASDVCVPSSIREGFGLNIIEAMACGVPVVAYDNRGHRTIIKNTENGYIVSNSDAVTMAERVDYLLVNDVIRNQIVFKANNAINRYSVQNAVDTLSEIYKRGAKCVI